MKRILSLLLSLFILLSCEQQKPKVLKPLDMLAKKNWEPASDFTFDPQLSAELNKVLKESKSDYVAVSVIDNNTGKILYLNAYSEKEKRFAPELAINPVSPAASLAKIISAVSTLENNNLDLQDKLYYRGKRTTLYKYQLKAVDRGRDSTFEKAFSTSNNVILAQLALQNSSPKHLFKTATKFHFNQELLVDGYVLRPSNFALASNEYEMAELASGLNTQTLISPLHAAWMVSLIARGGTQVPLRILQSSKYSGVADSVVKAEVAHKVRQMMMRVAKDGTAGQLSRRLGARIKERLDFGGKTGRMTGGIPYGTRDWFAFFVQPKGSTRNLGWSVAIMVVNEDKWTIRPTHIAKKLIEYYYAEIVKSNIKG